MTNFLTALSGATNASQPLPNLATSGQPSAAHLEALSKAGVKVVIDLRDPGEARPLDEPATVKALGMEYINIPIGPGTRLDDALMDRILGTLRANADQPALLHCASANRVGGALIAHFILDHQMEQDDAIDAAQRVGLRSMEYVDWALAYVERHSV
jgi:protein tyrosine phosphatase (PTP) superfamily phosphohydrolase (DUF442 family)